MIFSWGCYLFFPKIWYAVIIVPLSMSPFPRFFCVFIRVFSSVSGDIFHVNGHLPGASISAYFLRIDVYGPAVSRCPSVGESAASADPRQRILETSTWTAVPMPSHQWQTEGKWELIIHRWGRRQRRRRRVMRRTHLHIQLLICICRGKLLNSSARKSFSPFQILRPEILFEDSRDCIFRCRPWWFLNYLWRVSSANCVLLTRRWWMGGA